MNEKNVHVSRIDCFQIKIVGKHVFHNNPICLKDENCGQIQSPKANNLFGNLHKMEKRRKLFITKLS